ncbi:sulfurtransferase [Halieaceae bacterium IMCC14734]|uniref:Sulfurtransferase n=1 Tax=Candidatus Litorirhabdus singularis TaxID=2518993 RepID=A0ABT3TFR1_9GAMM|nr:sulfurtransferase [Candidatus Litorirhabdus singularis]
MARSPLIGAAELCSKLGEVVVVDCRFSLAEPDLGVAHYTTEHIVGAHYCHLEHDLSAPVAGGAAINRGRHPLPEAATFCGVMAALGIGRDTPVVAYDDSGLAFASRLWWMLNALGYTQVQVLDGGWSAWQELGLATTAVKPEIRPVTAHSAVKYAGIVEFPELSDLQAAGARLIDAREPARYRGELEPIDPVAGHIPGAVNYPWQEATDATGRALPIAEQRERWQQLEASEKLIVYCGSGVTACVNILSLVLAGRDDALLYPGSWSDWCARLPNG